MVTKKSKNFSDASAASSDLHSLGRPPADGGSWTFLSNHSHVLLLLAQEPDLRLRDVAQRVSITERAVQKIVAELEDGGVLTRRKDGRRNHYEVHPSQSLRHPVEAHCTVADLIAMVYG